MLTAASCIHAESAGLASLADPHQHSKVTAIRGEQRRSHDVQDVQLALYLACAQIGLGAGIGVERCQYMEVCICTNPARDHLVLQETLSAYRCLLCLLCCCSPLISATTPVTAKKPGFTCKLLRTGWRGGSICAATACQTSVLASETSPAPALQVQAKRPKSAPVRAGSRCARSGS